MITIPGRKRNLFLAVFFSALFLTFSPNVRAADECGVCSAASRSDSLLGSGGIEYLIQQQQGNVSPLIWNLGSALFMIPALVPHPAAVMKIRTQL